MNYLYTEQYDGRPYSSELVNYDPGHLRYREEDTYDDLEQNSRLNALYYDYHNFLQESPLAIHPPLYAAQAEIVFTYLRNGKSLGELLLNQTFRNQYSKEELDLLRRGVLPKCSTIEDLVVFCNIRSIAKYIYSRGIYGLPFDDLLQEGILRAYRAVKRYDPNHRENKGFHSYLKGSLENHYKRLLGVYQYGVKLPAEIGAEDLPVIEWFIEQYMLINKKVPTIQELKNSLQNSRNSNIADIPIKIDWCDSKIDALLYLMYSEILFPQDITEVGEDVLLSKEEGGFEGLEENERLHDICIMTSQIMDGLNPGQRRVLIKRYVNEELVDNIAAEEKVSRAAVQHRMIHAENKVRKDKNFKRMFSEVA